MKPTAFALRLKKKKDSFSLVELLVVMTIAAVLAVLSIGAYTKVTRAMVMSSSVQAISGAFNLARQTAVAQNSDVEFRVYQLPDYNSSSTTPVVYRAFQTFLIKGTTTNALSKINFLPSPAIFSANTTASTFLSLTAVAGSTFNNPLPVFGSNYKAVVFRFSPNGGLEPTGLSGTQGYLTLVLENDTTSGTLSLPADFATVQVDQWSGAATVYRP